MTPTRSDKPHDRITHVCDMLISKFANDPRITPEDRLIVFISDGDNGGMAMHGYEDDAEAVGDIFIHLKALLAVNGQKLAVFPIHPPVGEG